ncbi:Gfo/Idh/MocA family oxidoreductase [Streptomyces longwoodensis]|jgi:myo-inositol 2-dehydrogenase/D-chiro-inositol 1-dehydrogenase|uniref:Dehydrogenase n=1 Tax=Streptomyces lasalocidi TaxID=324833 RepID=A0A4U5WPF8_STRLS|nr:MULTISPECIES: Gfo/Idh/MocA family oxidoreductase [Streptomyces]MCX4996730.1 Gfo/Idh/MocA family oxidoreductase [Streptomyces longwoodensis]TKT03532.1 dehydrogenase [Streptomyces lasalocidi]WRY91404.1 Gfo/Idh/MocA family oxidoreductase [Streptomyces longwoodensis]WTI44301.1 Gfo/Idh/MocA family oxidoreductase [Streptomyces longwoodensis]WUC57095.1 Gfo/Idh/MocA family oxidoreductase [Streptomyces longwoodensis]
MRIGVIGTGRLGTIHANTLSRHREVGSLILTDADPARAQDVALRLGETAAPGVDEIFRWGVDAVVITTSTSAHADLIGRAARSGLPVFCEKPIALDLPGTLQAIAEVESAGTVLQMGFQRRFDAGYTGAREAVRSGRLGRLHTVRAVTSDQSPPPPEWLPVSGGIYRDALIHDFDALRWVTGREVADVYAAGSDAGPPVFRAAGDVDTAAVVLTLDDGTLATATATRMNGAGYDVRMELAGERDQIVVGLDDRTPIASTEPTGPPAADKPWAGFLERFAPAYEAELAAFIEVVRGERANPCDGREALQALRIAEACALSHREHRPVSLREVPGAPEPTGLG